MDDSVNKQMMFIRAFFNTDEIIRRLEFCHSLYSSLDDELKKKVLKHDKSFSNFDKYIENILQNEETMRTFKLKTALSQGSEAIMYFGKDYGGKDPYDYKTKIEETICSTNVLLLRFVNVILKELKLSTSFSLE